MAKLAPLKTRSKLLTLYEGGPGGLHQLWWAAGPWDSLAVGKGLNLQSRARQQAVCSGFYHRLLSDGQHEGWTPLQICSGNPSARIGDKGAGRVNISPPLVTYAAKVLRHGCPELIAAVESGALAVSTAAALAGTARGGAEEGHREWGEGRRPQGPEAVRWTAPGSLIYSTEIYRAEPSRVG